MSVEYGIFNDEGCLERGFWSFQEAYEVIAERYPDEPFIEVHEMCACGCEEQKGYCEQDQ